MVKQAAATRESVMRLLSQVKDPEVPVLNIVEMGIVRGVELDAGSTRVSITPTYSGCPAMEAIEQRIRQVLDAEGFVGIQLERVYAPPWTTDWMTDEAREKLREYGIAPPAAGAGRLVQLELGDGLACPYCGSRDTRLDSAFGATACKALHFCRECRQPFESFKAI